ncbi:hypothetical protein N579_0112840 [Corynebacterium pseudodiphtheriticum 090104]|nr:hypothetical protein N579_0112840 [Corynebacterium pseudodiphtheriticum 090104]
MEKTEVCCAVSAELGLPIPEKILYLVDSKLVVQLEFP